MKLDRDTVFVYAAVGIAAVWIILTWLRKRSVRSQQAALAAVYNNPAYPTVMGSVSPNAAAQWTMAPATNSLQDTLSKAVGSIAQTPADVYNAMQSGQAVLRQQGPSKTQWLTASYTQQVPANATGGYYTYLSPDNRYYTYQNPWSSKLP